MHQPPGIKPSHYVIKNIFNVNGSYGPRERARGGKGALSSRAKLRHACRPHDSERRNVPPWLWLSWLGGT